MLDKRDASTPDNISWQELLERLFPQTEEESFRNSLKKSLESIAQLTSDGTLTDEDAQALLRQIVAAVVTRQTTGYVNRYFECPKCREKRLKTSGLSLLDLSFFLPLAHRR